MFVGVVWQFEDFFEVLLQDLYVVIVNVMMYEGGKLSCWCEEKFWCFCDVVDEEWQEFVDLLILGVEGCLWVVIVLMCFLFVFGFRGGYGYCLSVVLCWKFRGMG